MLSKLSSSFGNLDPFGTGQPLPPLQLPQQTAPQSVVLPLKKPPKWIRRPMGASFSVRRRLGWAGLARGVVLAPAELLRKRGVQCGAPPWEIFPFVITVGDAQGSFQTRHWEQQKPDQNAWGKETLLRDICVLALGLCFCFCAVLALE